ncbi:MAG: hypothetical protein AAF251_05025 [Pseudomonadota bacterium]
MIGWTLLLGSRRVLITIEFVVIAAQIVLDRLVANSPVCGRVGQYFGHHQAVQEIYNGAVERRVRHHPESKLGGEAGGLLSAQSQTAPSAASRAPY